MGFVYAVLLRDNLGGSKGTGVVVSSEKVEGTPGALLLSATTEVTVGSEGGVGVNAGVGVSVSRRKGSAAGLGTEDDAAGVMAVMEPTTVVQFMARGRNDITYL